jgi:benzoate-CoA ligase family protein
VIVLGQPQGADELAFAAWIAGESTSLVAAETHRDDFCTLHYSSGTTGEPKGVLHAHKDYALIAQLSGIDLFGIGEDDRTFATAKLFFTYGLGGNLIFPWAVGASTVLYDGSARLPNPILEIIAQFRPTIFYSVPTNYLTLLSVNNFAQTYNLSSLRLCLSAGEALPVAVWQKWQAQTNLEILDTIGCTETLHTFLANRPDALRPGSSGKPFAGYEVKLEDEEGRAVPTGEIGNLLVRAESVALSYLHQYEKSRHTFRGEWLFTGDRYYRDEAGFYWHAGRSDELFKVGGLWVSPVEVEAVLASHPAVLACGVVGQAEQSELIKPKAFVQLQPDYAPSPDLVRDLLRHCGAQLAAHKCPRWIEFVEELPRTATGKLQRFKLRGAG